MTTHYCPRLRKCENHPRTWRVFRSSVGRDWWSIPPGPETFPAPDDHNHDTYAQALAYATEQARAQQVTAVQDGAR